MAKSHAQERREIARQLFGKEGDFPAFFALFDVLLNQENDFAVSFTAANAPEQLTYQSILHAADLIKNAPEMTKEGVTRSLYEGHKTALSMSKIEKATNLAVQAMLMVDCAPNHWHATDFVLGAHRPVSWLPGETYVGFFERSFPMSRESSTQSVQTAMEDRGALKAWKLQKRLGVNFRATNNLSEHLLFDPRSNCLYLFHHAEFLKAHLEKCRGHKQPLEMTALESFKAGTVPAQLLVETLHSLQSILFPPIDQKSAAILDKLTSRRRGKFDPECAEYEGYKIFEEPPEEFTYLYWGERLVYLGELLRSRPPRNKLERWLQWQNSEGNALLVAFLALLISICVGIISIGLAGVQVWISWMAWKHPITPG